LPSLDYSNFIKNNSSSSFNSNISINNQELLHNNKSGLSANPVNRSNINNQSENKNAEIDQPFNTQLDFDKNKRENISISSTLAVQKFKSKSDNFINKFINSK
jgi:hypothetical protein